jgi:hypothetical protein
MSKFALYTLLLIFVNASLFNVCEWDIVTTQHGKSLVAIGEEVNTPYQSDNLLEFILRIISGNNIPIPEDETSDEDPDIHRRLSNRLVFPALLSPVISGNLFKLINVYNETDNSVIYPVNQSRTIMFGHLSSHMHRYCIF